MCLLAFLTLAYADEAVSPPSDPPPFAAPAIPTGSVACWARPAQTAIIRDQGNPITAPVWTSSDVARIPGVHPTGAFTLAPAPVRTLVAPEAEGAGALDAGVQSPSFRRLPGMLHAAPAHFLGPAPSIPEVLWRGSPGVTLPGSERPWWVR